MRTVEQWLNDTETSFLVTDKESAADLAVFHQLKQVMTMGQITIDGDQFGRLSEWYNWIDE